MNGFGECHGGHGIVGNKKFFAGYANALSSMIRVYFRNVSLQPGGISIGTLTLRS